MIHDRGSGVNLRAPAFGPARSSAYMHRGNRKSYHRHTRKSRGRGYESATAQKEATAKERQKGKPNSMPQNRPDYTREGIRECNSNRKTQEERETDTRDSLKRCFAFDKPCVKLTQVKPRDSSVIENRRQKSRSSVGYSMPHTTSQPKCLATGDTRLQRKQEKRSWHPAPFHYVFFRCRMRHKEARFSYCHHSQSFWQRA